MKWTIVLDALECVLFATDLKSDHKNVGALGGCFRNHSSQILRNHLIFLWKCVTVDVSALLQGGSWGGGGPHSGTFLVLKASLLGCLEDCIRFQGLNHD